MISLAVEAGQGLHRVEALAVLMGGDVSLCLAGGPGPHIGAAALAVPRGSLQENGRLSASASVLCVTGHMEDLLARRAALKIAAHLNRRVVVSAGLHLDDAGPEDIELLQANSDRAVDLILEKLQKETRGGD